MHSGNFAISEDKEQEQISYFRKGIQCKKKINTNIEDHKQCFQNDFYTIHLRDQKFKSQNTLYFKPIKPIRPFINRTDNIA